MVGRGRENHGLRNFRALRCLPQLAWLDLRWQLARRQSRLKGWTIPTPGHEGVLWTKWSHESRLKACWLYDHTHMNFEAFLHTEVAKKVQRQRDEATRGGKAEFELVSMTLSLIHI